MVVDSCRRIGKYPKMAQLSCRGFSTRLRRFDLLKKHTASIALERDVAYIIAEAALDPLDVSVGTFGLGQSIQDVPNLAYRAEIKANSN